MSDWPTDHEGGADPPPTTTAAAEPVLELRRALARAAMAMAADSERAVRGFGVIVRRRDGNATSERVRAWEGASAAVREFARAQRARGAPPQHVIVLVKEAVQHAAGPVLDSAGRRVLTDDVVRWTIDAYYGS